MPKRIIPLILVLAVVGYFGHRAWVKRQAAREERFFYGTVEAVEGSCIVIIKARYRHCELERLADVSYIKRFFEFNAGPGKSFDG